jgi:SAM-dependent methyltransferase
MSNADETEEIRDRFESIYANDAWGGGSGSGSQYKNVIEYVNFLSNFMNFNDVKSVVDFGCGDWSFSQYINWSNIEYTGLDVSSFIIERNKKLYEKNNIKFLQFQDVAQIRGGDLIIIKDVFQHLSNKLISLYLDHFKKMFRYLLVTNDDFPDSSTNSEINLGEWRALRLDLPPFNETTATVFSWTIISKFPPVVRKRVYLIYGRGDAM